MHDILLCVTPYLVGAALGLIGGLSLGAWVRGTSTPEANPWVTRLTREWETRERWTHMGERDA